MKFVSDSKYKIHPETIFINDHGVVELFMKPCKPIAKTMNRWLIYEVIPSIKQKKNKKYKGVEECESICIFNSTEMHDCNHGHEHDEEERSIFE